MEQSVDTHAQAPDRTCPPWCDGVDHAWDDPDPADPLRPPLHWRYVRTPDDPSPDEPAVTIGGYEPRSAHGWLVTCEYASMDTVESVRALADALHAAADVLDSEHAAPARAMVDVGPDAAEALGDVLAGLDPRQRVLVLDIARAGALAARAQLGLPTPGR